MLEDGQNSNQEEERKQLINRNDGNHIDGADSGTVDIILYYSISD
jgi:hypothetical protein